MSTPLVNEEGSESWQWDSFTNLYDESHGNMDMSGLDWTSVDFAESNEGAAQYASLAARYTFTLGEKSESSEHASQKTVEHNSEPKANIRTKGRTRTSRVKGDQTAVEVRISSSAIFSSTRFPEN